MSVRPPSVAGLFYSEDPAELRRGVSTVLEYREEKRPALAVIVPHAGYRYSGAVAGATYASVEIPRDVVLLCFHHRGFGAPFAVWPRGAWATPLGEVSINEDLAARIGAAFPEAEFDETGHRDEHSGEVQLPFLQVLRPDVRIVPVALSTGLDAREDLVRFGAALASVLAEELVVCSTDLNHYEDHRATMRKDGTVIEPMIRLDVEGLHAAILEHEVTMCGYAPAMATLSYARERGATRGEVVLHRTSADAGGDEDRCVGYVGMRICGE